MVLTPLEMILGWLHWLLVLQYYGLNKVRGAYMHMQWWPNSSSAYTEQSGFLQASRMQVIIQHAHVYGKSS